MRKLKSLLTVLGIVCLSWTVSISSASAQYSGLNMIFTNDPSVSGYADTDIWVTILRGQAATNILTDIPNISYVDQPNGSNPFFWTYTTFTNPTVTNTGAGYSQSLQLSSIVANGGIRWNGNAPSAQVVISYGSDAAIQVTNSFYAIGQLAPNNPSDPSYFTRYQNFELTYQKNPGDQGDITAINYFGSQINISSYSTTNGTGAALQSVGYNQSTATLVSTMTNLLGPTAYGTTTSSAIVTNSSGEIVRINGPAALLGLGNGMGTYTNFNSYLGAIANNTNLPTLVITNNSAYNTTVPPLSGQTYSNANVSFNLTNVVNGDSTNGFGMTAVGSISVVFSGYTNGIFVPGSTTTNIYTNIQFIVSPNTLGGGTNPSAAAQFIYSASYTQLPNNTYFSNTANWLEFSNAMSAFKDGGGKNAMDDIPAQIAGELSSAFAFGLAGSTNLVTNSLGTNMIGALPSFAWWQKSNGVTPFDGAQTNGGFYDQYASIIYKSTSNSIYGYAYSDRFSGDSPLVNAYQYVDTNGATNYVGSWVVNLGAPAIGAPANSVPEPSYTWAILALLIGGAAFKCSRTKKKA